MSYCPYFAEEKTEAQRGKITCPRSHRSVSVAESADLFLQGEKETRSVEIPSVLLFPLLSGLAHQFISMIFVSYIFLKRRNGKN